MEDKHVLQEKRLVVVCRGENAKDDENAANAPNNLL